MNFTVKYLHTVRISSRALGLNVGDVTEWLQEVMSQLSRQYQAEHQKASVVEITDKIFRMPLGSIITSVDELKKLC